QRLRQMRQDLHLLEQRHEYGVARQFSVVQKARLRLLPFGKREAQHGRQPQRDCEQEEQRKQQGRKRQRFPWRCGQSAGCEACDDSTAVNLPGGETRFRAPLRPRFHQPGDGAADEHAAIGVRHRVDKLLPRDKLQMPAIRTELLRERYELMDGEALPVERDKTGTRGGDRYGALDQKPSFRGGSGQVNPVRRLPPCERKHAGKPAIKLGGVEGARCYCGLDKANLRVAGFSLKFLNEVRRPAKREEKVALELDIGGFCEGWREAERLLEPPIACIAVLPRFMVAGEWMKRNALETHLFIIV